MPYPRSLRQLLALARRDELVAHLLGLVVLHLRRRRCLRHRTLFRREPKVEGIELLAAALHTLLDVQEHTCADDGVACVGARLAELVAVVLAHLVPKGFEQPRRVLGLVEDEDVAVEGADADRPRGGCRGARPTGSGCTSETQTSSSSPRRCPSSADLGTSRPRLRRSCRCRADTWRGFQGPRELDPRSMTTYTAPRHAPDPSLHPTHLAHAPCRSSRCRCRR